MKLLVSDPEILLREYISILWMYFYMLPIKERLLAMVLSRGHACVKFRLFPYLRRIEIIRSWKLLGYKQEAPLLIVNKMYPNLKSNVKLLMDDEKKA